MAMSDQSPLQHDELTDEQLDAISGGDTKTSTPKTTTTSTTPVKQRTLFEITDYSFD
jgi:bacteriocin-like protein